MVGASAVPRLLDIIENIERHPQCVRGRRAQAPDGRTLRRDHLRSEPSSQRRAQGPPPNDPLAQSRRIGNVLRHEYERVAPDIIWHVVNDDLLPLDKACRDELARERAKDNR